MAIRKFKVSFTRQYEVETDENASTEFIIKLAQSEFNSDIEFGFIRVDDNCFDIKLLN